MNLRGMHMHRKSELPILRPRSSINMVDTGAARQYNSQYQAPSHVHQWYGIQPLPPSPSSEPSEGGQQYGARQPPSSVDRPRSRSSRRRQHRSSVGPTGEHGIDYMDQEQLGKHMEQCLRSLGPQGFKRLFNNMPPEFQVVIWEAPEGSTTDIDTLPEGGNRRCKRGSILCGVNGVCSYAVLRNGSSGKTKAGL